MKTRDIQRIQRIAREIDPSLHVRAESGPSGPQLFFWGVGDGRAVSFIVSLGRNEHPDNWWRVLIEAKWRYENEH